ncbi:hypothetical protein ABH923_000810 [Leifsonia sp. EB41]|uniref:hypothetical protein n=1 Tax=Leifsonia sp. EB41 TaxID=3156260 RepID=UPI00351470BB
MKTFQRVVAVVAVSAGVLAGGVLTVAPATAMSGFGIRTLGCGGGKTAQIDWKSTGTVNLFTFTSNMAWAQDTLVRQVTANGSYSYNSGKSTLNWGFGVSSGNVTSYTEKCVAFNR